MSRSVDPFPLSTPAQSNTRYVEPVVNQRTLQSFAILVWGEPPAARHALVREMSGIPGHSTTNAYFGARRPPVGYSSRSIMVEQGRCARSRSKGPLLHNQEQ